MTGGSRDVYQPVSDRVDHQLGGLVDPEGVHDIGAMNRHCIRTEAELVGNLLVGFAFHNQLQDLEFAGSKSGAALALQGGRSGHGGVENSFSRSHPSYSDGEFELHRTLEDVSASARVERLTNPG